MTPLWVKFTLRSKDPGALNSQLFAFPAANIDLKELCHVFSGIAAESVKNIGLKENSDCYGKG